MTECPLGECRYPRLQTWHDGTQSTCCQRDDLCWGQEVARLASVRHEARLRRLDDFRTKARQRRAKKTDGS